MRRLNSFMSKNIFYKTVVSGAVLILCGYIYLFFPVLYIQITALVFFVLALMQVTYGVIRFSKNLPFGYKYDSDEIPEEDIKAFLTLSRQMKVRLDDKKPFRYVQGLNDIGANIFQLKPYVLIDRAIYKTLDLNEKLSIMAHEFAHIKMCHIGFRALVVFIFLGVVYYTLPSSNLSILGRLIHLVTMLTAIFIALLISMYLGEYWADCVAMHYVQSKASFFSGIKKVVVPRLWGCDSITHPSINARISWINRKYP